MPRCSVALPQATSALDTGTNLCLHDSQALANPLGSTAVTPQMHHARFADSLANPTAASADTDPDDDYVRSATAALSSLNTGVCITVSLL